MMGNNQNPYNQQSMMPPQQPIPIGYMGRVRSGMRKIADKFPSWVSRDAVIAYLLALVAISLVYNSYAMQWYWWVFGIVGVLGFFFGSQYCFNKWGKLIEKTFNRKVFLTSLVIRVVMVFILYWFFEAMTGQPYMFESADEQLYNELGTWFTRSIREGKWNEEFYTWVTENVDLSDWGFPFYIGAVYYVTDDSVIAVRLLNALWSALTCLLVYKLGKRNFGESAGRTAAIFMMLEPHYIIYCGFHLKETLMIFLLVLFLERADLLLRSRNFRFWSIAPTFVLLMSLFLFRTPLGISAALGVILALVLSSQKVANLGRRWLLLILFVFGAGIFVGGRISSEIEHLWQTKDNNQELRMTTIQRTQGLAKYATKTVFAPMIFTIPFPTMVETEGQENHRLLHSGAVVKNITSFFCIMALVMLIINSGPSGWRNNVLLGAYLITYLMIIIQSAFVHADRFHLPAYVVELLFAAYGITLMTKAKHKRWYTYWCVLMFVAWIGWAYFKLAGRGAV